MEKLTDFCFKDQQRKRERSSVWRTRWISLAIGSLVNRLRQRERRSGLMRLAFARLAGFRK
jgi:hypothetical protein